MKSTAVSVGRFRLELRRSREGDFLGVGGVSFGGLPLRSAAAPWRFHASSGPFAFRRFRLLGVRPLAGGGATVRFESRGEWEPRSEETDAMDEPRVRAPRLRAPRAVFEWTFRPVRERVFENEWDGLSTRLAVRSPDAPLHTVLEAATWEIGGSAEGATLIQQDVSTIGLEQPVRRGSAKSF